VTPLRPSQVMTRFLEGEPAPAPGTFPFAQIHYVSPGFFKMIGLSLQEGRIFEQKDIEAQSTFVVNETFAQRYLTGKNSVGAKIVVGVLSASPEKVPVIGVVANARSGSRRGGSA
jgi:hypothetical protein